MSEKIRKIIAEFRSLLESRFPNHVVRSVVFGSYARGQETPDSDLDILVIVNHFSRQLENDILDSAYEIMWSNGFEPLLSVQVMDKEYYARLAAWGSSLFQAIQRDAVTF